MTDPTPETPSGTPPEGDPALAPDAPAEAPGADAAQAATPPDAGASPPVPQTVWGGAPTAPPAGWSQPAPTATPAAGWGQPEQPAPGWAPPPPPPMQPGPPAGWGQAAAPPPPPAAPSPWSQPAAAVPPMSPPPPPAGAPAPAGWAQPATTTPGWAMSATPPAEPQGSFTVALSGILLIIIGLLIGLVGVGFLVLGAAAKTFIDNQIANGNISGGNDPTGLANAIEGILAVLGVIIGLFGLGELFAGVGVLMKRQWGRILGIVLSLIAAVLTTLVLFAAVGRTDGSGAGVIVTLVFAIAYWFIVVALARGGRAFRHA